MIKLLSISEFNPMTTSGVISSMSKYGYTCEISYCYSFFWFCFFKKENVEVFSTNGSQWRFRKDGARLPYELSNSLTSLLELYKFEKKYEV